MKRFFQAAFAITLFQVIVLLSLSALKFLLIKYEIIDKIKTPFIWVCLSTVFLFVLGLSATGLIERGGQSFEEWKSTHNKSASDRIIANLISWCMTIPIIVSVVFFLYLIAPTSISTFISLYIGIVIRNCIDFFSEEEAPVA